MEVVVLGRRVLFLAVDRFYLNPFFIVYIPSLFFSGQCRSMPWCLVGVVRWCAFRVVFLFVLTCFSDLGFFFLLHIPDRSKISFSIMS